MKKITDQFICTDDTGNQYEIIEYTTFLTSRLLSGGLASAPGATDYYTSDGLPVNFIDKDTFQLSKADIVIRRVK